LIDDEHYHEDLEKYALGDKPIRQALRLSGAGPITNKKLYLFSTMQNIHDAIPFDLWPDTLSEIAKSGKLKLPQCVVTRIARRN
jgi:hypothetical protein